MWKDSETELDFLDYGYMVNLLKEIICNDELLPASIGLYGDWGSGKSSLMHMCIKELEADSRVKCLIFNGWLFESYGDAKTALLNSILDAIAEEKDLSAKAKNVLDGLYKSVDKFSLTRKMIKHGSDFVITGGISTLASLTWNTAVSIFLENLANSGMESGVDSKGLKKIRQNIKDELDEKKLRDDIREFQKQFAELVEESNISRLVIFVDELDRCREDTILDTLEAMKLFMFSGKVAFVIGADERHISYAVKSKFKDIEGIQIDIGKEYLEKLVQYPIRIPRMDIKDTEVYIALLLLSVELSNETFGVIQEIINEERNKDFMVNPLLKIDTDVVGKGEEKATITECISISRQLSPVLSKGLHGNPRQVKRFLNTLDMRIKMAEFKQTTLDRKVLAKLMLLEYIRSAAFNRFAELAVNNELIRELDVLENGDTSDYEELLQLKSWMKDDWLVEWIKSEPKLSDKELNHYFYFTRTSIDEKISRISVNLSPGAQEVLDNLQSKIDSKIKKAIEADVSDSEAEMIMEAMALNMNKETKINSKLVKAFVSFALKKRERFVSAYNYFKSFSATSLPPSSMVYFADFAKSAEMIEEMKEVAKQWGATNDNLEKAFLSSLD